jgi:hypothetical protein
LPAGDIYMWGKREIKWQVEKMKEKERQKIQKAAML